MEDQMEDQLERQAKQFVIFKLGNEDYGVDIQKVTTIEKILPIARVPKTQNYIKGVLNLRGEIILIMDLRTRFNLPEIEETEETRIIFLKVGENSFGVIVDEVDEVLEFKEDSIESVNNLANDLTLNFVLGAGKINGKIVTLLNLDKLIET